MTVVRARRLERPLDAASLSSSSRLIASAEAAPAPAPAPLPRAAAPPLLAALPRAPVAPVVPVDEVARTAPAPGALRVAAEPDDDDDAPRTPAGRTESGRTMTPFFGAHAKYGMPSTVPSCLPTASSSSTPTHGPSLADASPTKRTVPSPLSRRTRWPIVKDDKDDDIVVSVRASVSIVLLWASRRWLAHSPPDLLLCGRRSVGV